MGYPCFHAPILLLPFSRSNRCALSISDRRFWEPKEASQFAQWELSERDVIHPAYTCQMERCQEKTLAYAQTGIEILLVGNFRLHYTRRRENRNASEHWIGKSTLRRHHNTRAEARRKYIR